MSSRSRGRPRNTGFRLRSRRPSETRPSGLTRRSLAESLARADPSNSWRAEAAKCVLRCIERVGDRLAECSVRARCSI